MSDPQREIRLWLQRELADRPHGTKGRLAAYLGVRADAVTRMANTDPKKEAREIRAHELQLMEAFFSAADQSPNNSEERSPTPKISDQAAIRDMIERIDKLTPHQVTAVLSVIRTFINENARQQEQPSPDDLSESTIPRHE